MRIETTKQQKEISIPPFVKVLREVTDENEYATSFMARHDYKIPEADRNLFKAAQKEIKKQTSSPKPDKQGKRQIPDIQGGGDSPRLH